MENPSFSQQLKLVSAQANYWVIFILPLLLSGFIVWLTLNRIYPYDRGPIIVKNALEEWSLYITGAFCFMSLLRFLRSKEKFFLWATGLLMLFHFREFHPPHANIVTYSGLVWFFYYAYKNHHFFANYLRRKYLITLLGVGFFSYLIAVSTDERVWKDFIPIPGELEFHEKLEETLELIGHIAIGCALLFATKKPPENHAETQSGANIPV
jgi:hypothetical protein